MQTVLGTVSGQRLAHGDGFMKVRWHKASRQGWAGTGKQIGLFESQELCEFFFFFALLRQDVGEGNGTPLQCFAWTEEPGRLQSTGSHRVRPN